MERINQCQKVLNYINRYGSISTFQAFIDLGITRLASRINDLKNEGYQFTDKFTTVKNRDGVPVSFKVYKLKDLQQ